VTREKLYAIAPNEGGKVVYFEVSKKETDMPRLLDIELSGRCSARKKEFQFDLGALGVGARGIKGNTVTAYPIKRVKRAG
jgi:topoisomerase-4 subunit A